MDDLETIKKMIEKLGGTNHRVMKKGDPLDGLYWEDDDKSTRFIPIRMIETKGASDENE
jgi:hypothetical protein